MTVNFGPLQSKLVNGIHLFNVPKNVKSNMNKLLRGFDLEVDLNLDNVEAQEYLYCHTIFCFHGTFWGKNKIQLSHLSIKV